MTRAAPLCLAGLLCVGATECWYNAHLPLVHTSHVVGRFKPLIWEGPTVACPSEWTGLQDSAGLEDRLWVEIGPEVVTPAQLVRPDGSTVQTLPSAHGWQTLWAPTTLQSWFVTLPVTFVGQTFRSYFVTAYGEWGDCRPQNTAPCHYVRVDPWYNTGGFHAVTAGWVVRATGQACTTYWPQQELVCDHPGAPANPSDDWVVPQFNSGNPAATGLDRRPPVLSSTHAEGPQGRAPTR